MKKSISIEELNGNLVKMIHLGCPILTVQDKDKVNGMTVNWVQVGYLWNRPVVSVYVRPQRHTFNLINSEDNFSLAFLGSDQKENIAYLGKASGKDEDKLAHCGFTTSYINDTPYIDEAKTVFICKKLNVSDLNSDQFLDESIPNNIYKTNDFHRVFVAEIKEVLVED